MPPWPMKPLLDFFKTMGDENRLKIIILIRDREYRVSELAQVLELREPTISHHISKLREQGLANLRVDGNSHYYRLNRSMWDRTVKIAADLDNVEFDLRLPKEDKSWIDALDITDFDRKVLKDYTIDGSLSKIPGKQKKLLVILRWLATKFEADTIYTEFEVNEILKPYSYRTEDHVGLRRDLIEFGFLRRERGGGKYWLTPEDE